MLKQTKVKHTLSYCLVLIALLLLPIQSIAVSTNASPGVAAARPPNHLKPTKKGAVADLMSTGLSKKQAIAYLAIIRDEKGRVIKNFSKFRGKYYTFAKGTPNYKTGRSILRAWFKEHTARKPKVIVEATKTHNSTTVLALPKEETTKTSPWIPALLKKWELPIGQPSPETVKASPNGAAIPTTSVHPSPSIAPTPVAIPVVQNSTSDWWKQIGLYVVYGMIGFIVLLAISILLLNLLSGRQKRQKDPLSIVPETQTEEEKPKTQTDASKAPTTPAIYPLENDDVNRPSALVKPSKPVETNANAVGSSTPATPSFIEPTKNREHRNKSVVGNIDSENKPKG